MIELIRSEDRGKADHGWLQSRHTFSFADYQNPERVNFGPLRVVNEDWVAAGKGFDTHPHKDMEIITYMLDGELEHKDSMGNGSTIRPGELQRMSAGTGVLHSEFNPSADTPAHLLQIWLFPEENGLQETQSIDIELRTGRNSFLHIARGRVVMNDDELLAGDAVTIDGEATLTLRANEDAEMLLFDMT